MWCDIFLSPHLIVKLKSAIIEVDREQLEILCGTGEAISRPENRTESAVDAVDAFSPFGGERWRQFPCADVAREARGWWLGK